MTLDRIITAKDYCKREGVSSVKERIQKMQKNTLQKKGIAIPIQFDKLSPLPVHARIELGQWCADCECGGVEFVDADEPIFFCFGCGNHRVAGALRPVVFPGVEERKEIERLVLERPVDERRGLDDTERAHMATAVIYVDMPDGRSLPLTRTWNAGEPISSLVMENEAVTKWREASIAEKKIKDVSSSIENLSELAGE